MKKTFVFFFAFMLVLNLSRCCETICAIAAASDNRDVCALDHSGADEAGENNCHSDKTPSLKCCCPKNTGVISVDLGFTPLSINIEPQRTFISIVHEKNFFSSIPPIPIESPPRIFA